MLQPDYGWVRVNGQLIVRETDFPENAGILIGNPGFILCLSGYQNLMNLVELKEKRYMDEKVPQVLEATGLKAMSGKKVAEYSVSMRQRLSIAKAILGTPDCLILDEPMKNLDKRGQDEIGELLRSIKNLSES